MRVGGAMNQTVQSETLPQAPAVELPRNRFIPVDRGDVFERLLTHVPWKEDEAGAAEGALHYLSRLRQQDSCVNLDRLVTYYDPFNPDDETVNSSGRETLDMEPVLKVFGDELTALVEAANFEAISEAKLDKILTEASPLGVEVEVDMSEFDLLRIYARGESVRKVEIRTWNTLFLKKEIAIDSFTRLLIAIKLKPEPVRLEELKQQHLGNEKKAKKALRRLRSSLPKDASTDKVYIKVFKNVPVLDLEMLFPNTRVKMNYWDKVQLWVGGGSTTAVGIATAIAKILVVTAFTPVALLMALFGVGGVLFRQVMNVVNTRNKYMMHLAQTLYFHNLANNQSVLGYLIDEAEEENIKEELLLYVSLYKGVRAPGQLERARLDIEAFLLHHWGVKVDFDLEDAEARLRNLGLISTGPDGLIDVMTPGQARGQLMRLWSQSLERGRPVSLC
jgi:hypothetical protein